jgi:DNA-binding transcriptional MerR regulator
MMSDFDSERDDELLAIPRLAERVGVTPRVLRYWQELGLISPTREHGKLRYSPRDVAIAGLVRRLLADGAGVEGIRMLKRLAERDVRRGAGQGDENALAEEALRILYQRKAFREETGMDEEHFPEGRPPKPPGPPGPEGKKGPPGKGRGPRARHEPGGHDPGRRHEAGGREPGGHGPGDRHEAGGHDMGDHDDGGRDEPARHDARRQPSA